MRKVMCYKLFLCFISVTLICTYSCKRQNDISCEYDRMYGKEINLPLSSMQCFQKAKSIHHSSLSMVTFIDSSECTPCAIDDIYNWEVFINEAQKHKLDIEYIFIIAPQKKDIKYVNLHTIDIDGSIYIDTAYCFARVNKLISQNPKFHSFAIDKNNKIVFIGNPTRNDRIAKLYDKLIINYKH